MVRRLTLVITGLIALSGCSKSGSDVIGKWTCNNPESVYKFERDHTGSYSPFSPGHDLPTLWEMQADSSVKIIQLDPRISKPGSYEILRFNWLGTKLVSETGFTCSK